MTGDTDGPTRDGQGGETWLDTDIEASDASGDAAAALIESVAETLHEAPDGKRYDLTLDVTERDASAAADGDGGASE